MCDIVVGMAVDRLSITVDAELGLHLRRIAADEGMSVSRWVSEAIETRVRNHLLGEAVDAWEAEAGPFTAEEIAHADKIFAEAERLGQEARAAKAAQRLAG